MTQNYLLKCPLHTLQNHIYKQILLRKDFAIEHRYKQYYSNRTTFEIIKGKNVCYQILQQKLIIQLIQYLDGINENRCTIKYFSRT